MHMHMATGRIGGCAGGALESPGTMAGQAVARCRRPDRTAPMFLRCLAAFLPVDPLLALPRRQRDAEVVRVYQTQQAERDEKIAQLRAAVEAQLPAAAP